MNGRLWTKAEDKTLRRLYADTPNPIIAKRFNRTISSVHQHANILGLNKSYKYFCSINKGKHRSPATEFKNGQVSHNKGKKGWCAPGSEKGWFPKGHLPARTLYDGAITVRHDHPERRGSKPYKYIRIRRGKWRPYHQVKWERHRGKIPRGKIIVFKDRNTMNCKIENLECISRKQHGANWYLADGSIARSMSLKRGDKGIVDRKKFDEILQHPELIHAKRQQLKLQKLIGAR